MTLIATIFVFLFVIVFHEFGHFAVAKYVGIKVNEFSIGMGPKLFQKEKGETKYTLRALPIGGYVSMEGENENSTDERSFNNSKPIKKLLVILAGAFMNLVLAIIIFTIVSGVIGIPTTTIESVIENTPASKVYKGGEQILKINNKNIDSWNQIASEISNSKSDYVIIETKSNGNIQTNKIAIETKENQKIIGIKPKYKKSFLTSIKYGFIKTKEIFIAMFQGFIMLITGKLGKNNVMGPIGIINTIGENAKIGIIPVLNLMGLISVNLAFFNLLPIPALDGSKAFFIIIELLKGKPIDSKKEGTIHFIGFIILMIIMLIITYKDIVKLL